MMERVKAWVNDQLALGEFSSREQVLRRSAIMALRIAALAYFLNVASHLILYAAGVFPYDLPAALVIASVLTPLIALPVAFTAYYVVGQAVYELALSRAEFERLSRTDSLSGLLNRRAFLEAIETAVSPAALAIFDVDRFKTINDTLGHVAGDEVIVAVAGRLAALGCGRHIVARIGGEEFAVLVCGLSPDETLAYVEDARSLIEAQPVACGAGPIAVTVSAGVAYCAPGRDFDDLFSHADRALYLAKVSGRNRVVHERAVAGVVPPTRYEAPFDEMIRDLGGSRFATKAAARHQPKA